MSTIRIAAESDMQRIMEIEKETISPPWTHGWLLEEIYNDDSLFSLAVEGDAIIGFVILRRVADESELFQIAVDAAYRCRGIADSLLGAALEWARDCGIKSIFLEVRESNAAAIALYAKHGFRQTRRREDYYTEPVEDAVIMMRSVC